MKIDDTNPIADPSYIIEKIDDYTFFLDNNDKTQVEIFSKEKSYEKGTVKILKRLLKKGMNVINIGANIGYFTVIIAKEVSPSGQVFAFEPSPITAQLLRKNIKINNCENVQVFTKAITNTIGKSNLWQAASSVHNFVSKKGLDEIEKIQRLSLLGINQEVKDVEKIREKFEVDTTTIDNFVQQKNRPIDFLVMDAEGSEKYILDGMENTLKQNPHLDIITEYNPYTFELAGSTGESFLDKITELGFEIFQIDENSETIQPILKNKLIVDFKFPRYTNLYLTKNKKKLLI